VPQLGSDIFIGANIVVSILRATVSINIINRPNIVCRYNGILAGRSRLDVIVASANKERILSRAYIAASIGETGIIDTGGTGGHIGIRNSADVS